MHLKQQLIVQVVPEEERAKNPMNLFESASHPIRKIYNSRHLSGQLQDKHVQELFLNENSLD